MIVGLGSIGKKHATFASTFSDVGVVDSNTSEARDYAEQNQLTFLGAKLLSASTWNPDLIIICTPSQDHYETALQSLSFNKPLLIEKPITIDEQQLVDLIAAARKSKVMIFGVTNIRFSDQIQAIKTNIHRIGDPIFCSSRYGYYLPKTRQNWDYRKSYAADPNAGGIVFDAIHEPDYLCWLFGDAELLAANTLKIGDLDLLSADYANVTLKHNSGVISHIQIDYITPDRTRGCEIVGTKGILKWHSNGKNPEVSSIDFFDEGSNSWSQVSHKLIENSDNGFELMYGHIQMLLSGAPHELQTIDEAASIIRLVNRIRSNDIRKK